MKYKSLKIQTEDNMKKIYAIAGGVFILMMIIVLALTLSLLSNNNFNIMSDKGNIAVISIDNVLVLKTEDPGMFGIKQPSVKDYIAELNKAENDPNIKAIILKVNSPGGEVIASEELARKVKEVSKKKPVVAYVETMGASGAYMTIAPANYIVAEKHSIVGSIGVRMDMIHYYGLMKKLGINATVIKAGKYKDIGSPYRPMTPEEKAYLQKMINETYMDFVKWVAENRNMTINETLKVADGKIYSGMDAKKAGLVDAVGTEQDAINITAKIANISNPKTVEYNPSDESGLFGVVMSISNEMAYNFGYGLGYALSESEQKNVQMYY
jgi:protease-4